MASPRSGADRMAAHRKRALSVRARFRSLGDGSGYLFVLPTLALYVLFSVWPVIRGFALVFTDYARTHPDTTRFIWFDNFVEIFGDEMFWQSLRHTLYFMALFAPTTIIVALVIASLIASVRGAKLAGFYRVMIYFPVILPISVAMMLWSHVFNESFGWINIVLQELFGVPIESLPHWNSDPALTMPVTVVAVAWRHVGQNILLFLLGIYSINREIYEAAEVDGATPVQCWWYVTLPLLKPVFVIILVLTVKFFGITQEPMIMWGGAGAAYGGSGGPGKRAFTLGLYSYNVAFMYGDLRWGYAAALSLVAGVIGLAVAAIIFRCLKTESLQ